MYDRADEYKQNVHFTHPHRPIILFRLRSSAVDMLHIDVDVHAQADTCEHLHLQCRTFQCQLQDIVF